MIMGSQHTSKGFSLIEAMVAVGVAGVLAAVGLPWYGDSVRKSKVAEGVTLASPTKAKISGELMGLDRVPSAVYGCSMDANGNLVCPIPWQLIASNPSKNVSAIMRVGNSVIVNYSAELAGADGTLYSLLWTGTQTPAGVNWECLADAAASAQLSSLQGGTVPVQTALPAKWAPKQCRTS